MNEIQRHRLIRLCDLLEALPPDRFDFSRWVGENWSGAQELSCGTTACALGWAASAFGAECGVELHKKRPDWAVPCIVGEFDKERDGFDMSADAAERLFGLSREDAEFLFVPEESSYGMGDQDGPDGTDETGRPFADASPKRVARHIRDWLADQEAP